MQWPLWIWASRTASLRDSNSIWSLRRLTFSQTAAAVRAWCEGPECCCYWCCCCVKWCRVDDCVMQAGDDNYEVCAGTEWSDVEWMIVWCRLVMRTMKCVLVRSLLSLELHSKTTAHITRYRHHTTLNEPVWCVDRVPQLHRQLQCVM